MTECQEVAVSFEYAGRVFDFRICQRDLDVGLPKKVRYYWMDSAQLRQGTSGPNFRPCVDLWWHAGEQAGAATSHDSLLALVFAECYPLINTSKGMQDVYVDAHLSRTVSRDYSSPRGSKVKGVTSERTHQLSTNECQRLREITSTRDWIKIRNEFDKLFLGDEPSEDEMLRFNESARHWIGNGMVEFKKGGQQALQNYLVTLDQWIVKLRKQGQIKLVHRFLNRFAYKCKMDFYTCYCSAWVGIRQWLEQVFEPNVIGDRMMGMWHNQCDLLRGQVLALHPLSAFMHSSPEHFTTIGQWFGHPEYDSIVSSGKQEECEEYWQLVGSILIAAHEYHESRNRRKESRGNVTIVSTEAASVASIEDTNLSMDEAFEQVAAVAGHRCLKCKDDLEYVGHTPRSDDKSTVDADFRCKACGNQMTFPLSYDEIRQAIRRD